ncbi:hypothetical protein AAH029_18085, partial [Parabacteroides distasonis]|uniref:hypothetical protein n=1 Tax=Parabacteroides distasonis TaxID=823 RepID=UPI0039B59F99
GHYTYPMVAHFSTGILAHFSISIYRFDYLDTVEADKAEFVRIRDERIAAFKKRLEETGLKVIWNGNNCGRIEKGMFTYRFEFYYNGSVHEAWERNYNGIKHNDLEAFLSLPE